MNPVRVQGEDKKEDKKDKKGLLANLLSLFGRGAAGSGGVVATGSGVSLGSAAGAGFFATKAGMVALAIGGTAVAAGVGILGSQFLGGPSSAIVREDTFVSSPRAALNADPDAPEGAPARMQVFNEGIKFDEGDGSGASGEGGEEKPAETASASASAPSSVMPAIPDAPKRKLGGASFGDSPTLSAGGGGGGGGGSTSAAGRGLSGAESNIPKGRKGKMLGLTKNTKAVGQGGKDIKSVSAKNALNRLRAASSLSRKAQSSGNFQASAAMANKAIHGGTMGGGTGTVIGGGAGGGAGLGDGANTAPSATPQGGGGGGAWSPPEPKAEDFKKTCENGKANLGEAQRKAMGAGEAKKFEETCKGKKVLQDAAIWLAAAGGLLAVLNLLGAQSWGTGFSPTRILAMIGYGAIVVAAFAKVILPAMKYLGNDELKMQAIGLLIGGTLTLAMAAKALYGTYQTGALEAENLKQEQANREFAQELAKKEDDVLKKQRALSEAKTPEEKAAAQAELTKAEGDRDSFKADPDRHKLTQQENLAKEELKQAEATGDKKQIEAAEKKLASAKEAGTKYDNELKASKEAANKDMLEKHSEQKAADQKRVDQTGEARNKAGAELEKARAGGDADAIKKAEAKYDAADKEFKGAIHDQDTNTASRTKATEDFNKNYDNSRGAEGRIEAGKSQLNQNEAKLRKLDPESSLFDKDDEVGKGYMDGKAQTDKYLDQTDDARKLAKRESDWRMHQESTNDQVARANRDLGPDGKYKGEISREQGEAMYKQHSEARGAADLQNSKAQAQNEALDNYNKKYHANADGTIKSDAVNSDTKGLTSNGPNDLDSGRSRITENQNASDNYGRQYAEAKAEGKSLVSQGTTTGVKNVGEYNKFVEGNPKFSMEEARAHAAKNPNFDLKQAELDYNRRLDIQKSTGLDVKTGPLVDQRTGVVAVDGNQAPTRSGMMAGNSTTPAPGGSPIEVSSTHGAPTPETTATPNNTPSAPTRGGAGDIFKDQFGNERVTSELPSDHRAAPEQPATNGKEAPDPKAPPSKDKTEELLGKAQEFSKQFGGGQGGAPGGGGGESAAADTQQQLNQDTQRVNNAVNRAEKGGMNKAMEQGLKNLTGQGNAGNIEGSMTNPDAKPPELGPDGKPLPQKEGEAGGVSDTAKLMKDLGLM